MFLFVSLSLTFGQQVFLPLIWNLKHWKNLDLIISGSQDQHFKMDEMQANCPLEPEGVNAFKITHTFLLGMCWPLKSLPRTSQWLLIQMKKLYQVMPTKTVMSYFPPPAPNAPNAIYNCFPFLFSFLKKNIYTNFFLSYKINYFLEFPATLWWPFTNGRVHICHDRQPPFYC